MYISLSISRVPPGARFSSRTTWRCPNRRVRRSAFFMYPQAETTGGRLDCLDPDSFKYEITSRQIRSPNG
jgi:hypothetical protein